MAYQEWPLLASQMGLLLMDHATVGSHFFISQFDQFLSKATLILTTYLIGIYAFLTKLFQPKTHIFFQCIKK